jgi:starch synthase
VTAVIDEVEVGFWAARNGGVDFVFIDHPSYQRPGGLYGDTNGVYGDNQWRFKLLCQAGLEAALQLPLGERGVYGQDIVFVANGARGGLEHARLRGCRRYPACWLQLPF